MKILDLGWGHPGFLYEYWEMLSEYSYLGYEIGNQYELDGGIDILKDAIYNLHSGHENAVVSDKHIVIGNGATQILRCLLKVLRPNTIKLPAPYYVRFPDLIEDATGISNDEYCTSRDDADVSIITSPNNPTCEPVLSSDYPADKVIFDHCYNWSQYGPITKHCDGDIMVNSLSKATGHPGIRVGWALIRDDKLAKDLIEAIELESCGVSIPSQLMAVNIIQSQLSKPKKEQCFWFGRYELKYRWAMLKKHLGYAKNIDPINRLGMFAVIKVQETEDAYQFFLDKYGIKTVPGSSIGLDRKHARVNIGCTADDFNEFIKRLSGATVYEANKS